MALALVEGPVASSSLLGRPVPKARPAVGITANRSEWATPVGNPSHTVGIYQAAPTPDASPLPTKEVHLCSWLSCPREAV